jgi:hypothetical protein
MKAPNIPLKRKAKGKKPAVPKAPPRKESPKPVLPVLESYPLPAQLSQKLAALRSRRWSVGVLQGLLILACPLPVLWVVQGLADWSFDLPWIVRAVFLIADLAILGWLYRLHLHGVFREKPTLAQIALMVEKKWPSLRSNVVSAVELADGRSGGTRGSLQLVQMVLEQARARTATLDFAEVVPLKPLRRWFLIATGAWILGLGVAAVSWPSSLVLFKRILLSSQPLPTRTIVEPITRDMAVAVGNDVTLSARALGELPSRGRVTIQYAGQPVQEFPVTPVSDKEKPEAKADVFSLTLRNLQKPFTYRFYLNDGRGPEFKVNAKEPPATDAVTCRIIYPDYTGRKPEDRPTTDLSVMAGSRLVVQAAVTQELQGAAIHLEGLPDAPDIPMEVSNGSKRISGEIPVPAKGLTGFSLKLVNTDGIKSANETVYPVEVVPDKAPVVKILLPRGERETIILKAKPVIAIEVSDDYSLTKVTLNYQVNLPPVDGETPPPGEVQRIDLPLKDPKNVQKIEYTLDVASQKPAWQEGYTINYWVEAADNNTVTGPSVTESEHKQFGVISLEAKEQEMSDRIRQSANAIDTLSTDQEKLSNQLGDAIKKK